MNGQISPLEISALAEVQHLEPLCFDDPWPTSLWQHCLQTSHLQPTAWVLHQGEQLLAFILCHAVLDQAEVMRVAVHPDWQRQGCARRLMSYALDSLQSQGISELNLEVRRSNLAAQALYRRLGLSEVGIRPGYYDGEDALLFQSCLNGGS
ncbi:ribosomal protein S18-alanine N-acetyltransferase [Nitrincola tapanii]|uniref:[Ribosomal protein bS18]-alanine N-acetyltransferase n=1 Tax=Nitrincola tapanii TaxID=1708751 RepID=A0A5A9W262_9GAMM|nr:ribosomal protein S18-alanine N-acetyltransferase [Nitrincola tapanii]KAA0874643.1 ribosomal-protein-alanine N-acetyltransferase [Nitrincola tapanii]